MDKKWDAHLFLLLGESCFCASNAQFCELRHKNGRSRPPNKWGRTKNWSLRTAPEARFVLGWFDRIGRRNRARRSTNRHPLSTLQKLPQKLSKFGLTPHSCQYLSCTEQPYGGKAIQGKHELRLHFHGSLSFRNTRYDGSINVIIRHGDLSLQRSVCWDARRRLTV